ncbi:MAG: acyl carrier protein [Lachnospiraceae bacterium]|jgi:acyl carrier protein|nr:acyl carrier protein [Lachnospiraceae bacterium]
MTKEAVYEVLHEVFRDVFDDESIVLKDQTTAADIDGWDSLEHVGLVLAIEEAFGMKFTMSEVRHMENVGEMVAVLMERGQLR